MNSLDLTSLIESAELVSGLTHSDGALAIVFIFGVRDKERTYAFLDKSFDALIQENPQWAPREGAPSVSELEGLVGFKLELPNPGDFGFASLAVVTTREHIPFMGAWFGLALVLPPLPPVAKSGPSLN